MHIPFVRFFVATKLTSQRGLAGHVICRWIASATKKQLPWNARASPLWSKPRWSVKDEIVAFARKIYANIFGDCTREEYWISWSYALSKYDVCSPAMDASRAWVTPFKSLKHTNSLVAEPRKGRCPAAAIKHAPASASSIRTIISSNEQSILSQP